MEKTVPTSNTQNTNGETKMGYFADRPDVVKIFDDLDQFRDFCRFEGFNFNEADLYNKKAFVFREFEYWKSNNFKLRPRKPFKKHFKKKVH
jgi:hypothetical protein